MVVVGNLPFSTAPEDVRGFFHGFKDIHDIVVFYQPNGIFCDGTALVHFKDSEDAFRATLERNLHFLNGRCLNLTHLG